MQANSPTHTLRSDALLLGAFAALLVVVHFAMGNGYGFHRDELQFLDDARHLQWGFVAYPPMTAFCGRLAISLFGISPQVFRLPAALVNAASLVLVGFIARELGGSRVAQCIALAAVFPVGLAFSTVLQYNTFDLLAWCTVALFTTRVLRSEDERNWIGVGVGIGFGVLSKYSIAFALASLLIALVVLPSQRHHLRSRWFWYGAVVATLIAAPNLLWLARHHFITLQMEHFIHARDVRLGRADGYFSDQLKFTLFALPLAVAGLVSLLRSTRFRLLSAFYLGPLVLFALMKGRGYYLLPAYPVLYAAGAVALVKSLGHRARALRNFAYSAVALGTVANIAAISWVYLPVWPVGSAGWRWQMKNNDDMANEVGWPEFVAQVAAVRDALPPQDRKQLAVLAKNYGEAGALSLYGPQYGLPTPISTVNSFHDRGFGAYVPQTVIIVGGELHHEHSFRSCSIAGHVHLPNGVHNEETDYRPQILVCRDLLKPVQELWAPSQTFG